MNSNTFTALVAISSTLLGVTVSGVLQYYLSNKQDKRRFKHDEEKKFELDQKRKVAAYMRLKGLADRVAWRSPISGVAWEVEPDELDKIESTLANNYDVIEDTTITAWDRKDLKHDSMAKTHVVLECEAFLLDVNNIHRQLLYRRLATNSKESERQALQTR